MDRYEHARKPVGDVAGQSAQVRCLRVQDGGQEYPLDQPEIFVGRSRSCQIVLDEPLVSRRHAKITVLDGDAVLEDLGSVNGVHVNGARLAQPQVLADGDRVLIGRTIMVVGRVAARVRDTDERHAAATVMRQSGEVSMPGARDTGELRAQVASLSGDSGLLDLAPPGTGPRGHDAFETLGQLAEKALAMGHGAEAEKILSARLVRLLDAARAGTPPSPQVSDQACRWALILANATGRGAWIDYAVDLFMALERPWPAPVVDELFDLARRIDGISLARLREYARVLRVAMPRLGPAERFLVQRIEGIERVVASR